MDKYKRFKQLLEYFVSHLEWVVNQDKNRPGYEKYIEPVKDFKWSGRGYAGYRIQNQIAAWSQYNEDCIHINIDARGYVSTRCYLNWNWTWVNVRPKWNVLNGMQQIGSLYLTKEAGADAREELSCSLNELGLFDNGEPNDSLKIFFDRYENMLMEVKENKNVQSYVELLRHNHNLILTGAPGTGKTYLAKLIAKQLGATVENGQCWMVQFHPSYDYTDFIEGLRPVQNGETGEIGFELKRGIFKQFCAYALENWLDSQKSEEEVSAEKMFKNAYDEFIDEIRNGEVTELPLKSGSTKMEIVDVSDNNNILLQTKGAETVLRYTVSYNRLKKLSEVYKDLEALNGIKNIYKAVTSAIKGCHSSAYWAALHYLYKHYLKNTSIDSAIVEKKNFIFIIDEINRGEISKIFGELFFSIDPEYRGVKGKVATQYQNLVEEGDLFEDGFYIPENVYIIGTMNDIDRSVESMDFAMRRRFAWKEVKATDRLEMLKDLDSAKYEAVKRLEALNKAIEQTEGLSPAYHIGPAYFRKIRPYLNNTSDAWASLWDNHLKGLLYEYLRGSEEINEKMEILKKAYNSELDDAD